ncbi:MAG TPA: zinc ribbon domain-containing protein [Candidatus Woesebacteria bacterium]|nr:zinc ribbon domain-containing protein [Candidatus Woesebacteria bacterium]HPJ17432.1 zinc ribbon domain-containing protein [Candidatus Woesebacteria bacterium]
MYVAAYNRTKKERYGLVGEICPHCNRKVFPRRAVCPGCDSLLEGEQQPIYDSGAIDVSGEIKVRVITSETRAGVEPA